MAGLADHAQDLAQRHVGADRDDVGARHHDVLDAQVVQAEDVAHHGALLGREDGIGAGVLQRVLNVVADRGGAEAEDGADAVEQGRPRRRRRRLGAAGGRVAVVVLHGATPAAPGATPASPGAKPAACSTVSA